MSSSYVGSLIKGYSEVASRPSDGRSSAPSQLHSRFRVPPQRLSSEWALGAPEGGGVGCLHPARQGCLSNNTCSGPVVHSGRS